MGRGLTEDPLFFGAALAAGATLAELVGDTERSEDGAGEAERSIAPPGRS
jgi:hypothetical protein